MKILIVTMQHGNEIFGQRIIDHFKDSSVDTIIANPKAYEQKKRFIETDMNRSYQRDGQKSYEEKRADEIYELTQKYDFVIDIHTTTSNIDFVPIVARMNDRVKQALSHLPSDEIAQMEFTGVDHSLIGCVDDSISLEFNEDFAKTKEALQIVGSLVDGLQENTYGSSLNKILYHIVGTIPEDTNLDNEHNFIFSKNHDYHPFLIGEKHYKGYKGFYAEKTSSIQLYETGVDKIVNSTLLREKLTGGRKSN